MYDTDRENVGVPLPHSLVDAVGESRDESEVDAEGDLVTVRVPDDDAEEHVEGLVVPEPVAQMVVDEDDVTLGDDDEARDAVSRALGDGLCDAEIVPLVD